jgi:Ca2+/Na+ antiporter
MDAITGYISAHPAVLTILIVFVVMVILYFVFKQLIKLALVILLIVLAVVGFYYIKDPDTVKKAIDTMSAGVDEAKEKGKSFFRDSKNLFNKTKEVPGEIDRLIKGADEKSGK